MELGIKTANAVRECGSRHSRLVEQRLDHLLRLNAEIARQKSLYTNDEDKKKAFLMTRPMDSRHAFGTFGMFIGSLPPLALVVKILVSRGVYATTGLLLLIAAAGLVTGIVAFQIGRRYIPGALRYISGFSLPNRVGLWAVLGLMWGATSGAAGGLVIFLIGSIFAGIAGGVIGAVAVPTMVALHSSVRVGDLIEPKHFLPIALGIIFSICSFILGL